MRVLTGFEGNPNAPLAWFVIHYTEDGELSLWYTGEGAAVELSEREAYTWEGQEEHGPFPTRADAMERIAILHLCNPDLHILSDPYEYECPLCKTEGLMQSDGLCSPECSEEMQRISESF